MGKPEEPDPVKLFTGLLTGQIENLGKVEEELEENFGPIDEKSPLIPFNYTDYYRSEMGKGLMRKFVSFRNLVSPETLPGIKLKTNEIEQDFSDSGEFNVPRPVNIDPGYVGLSKLVLATTKNYSHRIYLGKGIYAEVTLQYKDGSFQHQPWTYPDYRSNEYIAYFDKLREKYKQQLKLE
ncbi:MAG: DUF4416 family protein [Candidatus Bipolaricaulota bacterium]